MGSITDAGGNGDEWFGDEPRDHTGQGSFHSRGHDDDVRFLDDFQFLEQSMQSRHTHVGDSFHAIAHDFGGNGGFLCDWQIAGAGTHDCYVTAGLG